jgi:hypothetical protein
MAYRINRTDGTLITEVIDGTIDSNSIDITLIGKNYAGFGEILNENFVKLLENFASATSPQNPLQGQLWYDKNENRLKIYDGSTFRAGAGPIVSESEPVGLVAGDIWMDSAENQMYFYDGADLTLAGPAFTKSAGTSGFVVEVVKDSQLQPVTITKVYSGNILLGAYSPRDFTPLSGVLTELGSPIKLGFNAVVGAGFTINNAVVDTASYLIDSQNIKRSAAQFLPTYKDGTINGRLTVADNDGIVIGASGQVQHTLSSELYSISSIYDNQKVVIDVSVNGARENAVTVNTPQRAVGIFQSNPTYTLDVGGNTRITGNLIVEGSTTTIQSTELVVEDANIVLGNGAQLPADVQGGGITLAGANASITFDVADNGYWTSSEALNVPSLSGYYVNKTRILDIDTLGSTVVNSSLTTVGTLTELQISDANGLHLQNSKLDSVNTITIDPQTGILIFGVVGSRQVQLKNLADPSSAQDATTKGYVDALVASNAGVNTVQGSGGTVRLDSNRMPEGTQGDPVYFNGTTWVAATYTGGFDGVSQDLNRKYYTDERVQAYLSANNYTTTTYVNTIRDNIIGTPAPPSNMNSLAEISASIGDIPDFKAYVDGEVATRISAGVNVFAGVGLVDAGNTQLTSDITINVGAGDGIIATANEIRVDLSVFDTDDLSEGTVNLYFTALRARQALTGSTGVTYNSSTGAIAIGQDVATTASPLFAGLTTTGNTILGGTTTQINSTNLRFAGLELLMNSDETAAPADNVAFTVERGTANNVSIRWNETNDQWEFSNNGITFTPLGSASVFTGTTDGVPEGVGNLYYTDARARAALSGGTGVTYNNTTGLIAIGQDVATSATPTFASITTTATGTELEDLTVILDTVLSDLRFESGGIITNNNANGSVIIKGSGTGSVIFETDIEAADAYIARLNADQIYITGNRIQSNVSSADLELDAAGGGVVRVLSSLDVLGDLSVQGTVTTVNSTTVTIADNIIVLNSNATGTPTLNAGIEVERGDLPNVQIQYNESTDKWNFTNDGTTYFNVPVTTSDLAEGTNLYYTQARFDTALGNKTTADLTEGTNLYYTTARFNADFNNQNTSNLPEGTNLYYTDTRARAAISVTGDGSYNNTSGVITIDSPVDSVNGYTGVVALTSNDVSEGNINLYFTNTRARNAVSGGTGVSYDNQTGQISIGQAVASTSSVTFNSLTTSNTILSNGAITVRGDRNTLNYATDGHLKITGSSNQNFVLSLGYETNADFAWITAAETTQGPRNLVLHPTGSDVSGKVGIGTTTPQSLLDVAGTVKAEAIDTQSLGVTSLVVDNTIELIGNRIGTLNSNSDLEFRPQGTGNVYIPTAYLGIGYDNDIQGQTPNALSYAIDVNAGTDTVAGRVKNTDSTSNAGPFFNVYRDSANPADLDFIGGLQLTGNDNLGAETAYSRVRGQILDFTNTTKASSLIFENYKNNAYVQNIFSNDEVVFNETGADVDFRIEGNGSNQAFFVQGSDGNIGMGTASPVQKLDINGNIGIGGVEVVSSQRNLLNIVDYTGTGQLQIDGSATLGALTYAAAHSINGSATFSSSTNSLTINGSEIRSLGGITVRLDTDVSGGVNEYFKVIDNGGTEKFSVKSSDGTVKISNAYTLPNSDGSANQVIMTNGLGAATYQTISSSVIAEGTNLFYTQGRFDTAFSNKSTTNLGEGLNLYYTDSRVQQKLADVSGSIIPDTNDTYDFGSQVNNFRTGYFGTGIGVGLNAALSAEIHVSGTGDQEIRAQSTSNGEAIFQGIGSGAGNGGRFKGNPDTYIGGSNSSTIYFESGLSEIMRMNSSQFIVGGGAYADTANRVMISTSGDMTFGTNTTANRTVQSFRNANGEIGSITTTGTATAFNQTSDYRLKEVVSDINDAVERVKALKPIKFTYIADEEQLVWDGFLAHEVQEVVPRAVFGEKDAVEDDGRVKAQQLDHSKLVPLLTSALQDALNKIEDLEARLAKLENK